MSQLFAHCRKVSSTMRTDRGLFQPEAFSNAAYLAAGAYLLAIGMTLPGLALLALGLASTWYHYGHSWPGRYADRAAMNVVAVVMMVELGMLPAWSLWLLVPAMIVVGRTVSSHSAVPALFGLAIGYGWQRLLPVVPLFLLALAVGQWAERFPKDHVAYEIGHAAWHVLTALALLIAFLRIKGGG